MLLSPIPHQLFLTQLTFVPPFFTHCYSSLIHQLKADDSAVLFGQTIPINFPLGDKSINLLLL